MTATGYCPCLNALIPALKSCRPAACTEKEAQKRTNRIAVDFELIRHVLHTGIEIRGFYPVLCILCGIALDFLECGDIERAIELAALLWSYPIVANSQWFDDIAGQEITAAIENIPPEVASVCQERGRCRDLWETARELIEELKDPIVEPISV